MSMQSYSTKDDYSTMAEYSQERPDMRRSGGRMRLVAKGAFVLMAVAVVSAALSRGQRSQATVLERKILIQQLLEDPVSTTPPPSTPAPATRIIGPSEKQWMAWEDAHGLPKECVPTKQVEKGPHGEEVITYYADCSMDMANPPTEDKAKKDGAVLKGKRGTSTSPQQELFHKANRVVPAFSVDKKAKARQALLKEAAKSADLVPPPLPPLLAVQKPKAKNAASPKLSPPKMSAKDKEAEAMLKSNLPQTPAQKRQTELFDQKVKAEEAKLVARDAARAQALIVDPDTSHTYLDDALSAHYGHGGQHGQPKLQVNPGHKVAKLADKATGPAAAILRMISMGKGLE